MELDVALTFIEKWLHKMDAALVAYFNKHFFLQLIAKTKFSWIFSKTKQADVFDKYQLTSLIQNNLHYLNSAGDLKGKFDKMFSPEQAVDIQQYKQLLLSDARWEKLNQFQQILRDCQEARKDEKLRIASMLFQPKQDTEGPLKLTGSLLLSQLARSAAQD